MKTWSRRILIAIALIVLALGILYECATHVGRGWLRSEAFFEGRPTSYWRNVILSEIAADPDLFDEIWGRRKPSLWESVCQRCGIETTRQRSHVLIAHTGGEAVLMELGHDRSPRLRAYAEQIVDYNTNELPRLAKMKPPFDMGTLVIMPWCRALRNARDAPANERIK